MQKQVHCDHIQNFLLSLEFLFTQFWFRIKKYIHANVVVVSSDGEILGSCSINEKPRRGVYLGRTQVKRNPRLKCSQEKYPDNIIATGSYYYYMIGLRITSNNLSFHGWHI